MAWWMDGWINEWREGKKNKGDWKVLKNEHMNKQIHERINGWMNQQKAERKTKKKKNEWEMNELFNDKWKRARESGR